MRLYNNTFYNNVAETHFNDRSVISFWNYGNDDGQADLIAYNNIIAYDTTSTSSNEGGIFAAKNDDPDGSGANYYVTNVYSGHNLFIGNVVNNTEPGDSLTAVLGDGDENNHHFDGGKLVGMDPMFNAVDMGYYYLKSGSPAIEAGMDVGLPYDDAAPHIGAFGPVPTVYTSPTASGSGESMDDPGELDALLADATPYQTVYFLPGTYEPTAKVEPDQDQHRGLKLIGMNGALETTIDGQSNTLLELIDLYEGMELAGFTIKDIGDGTWTKDLFNFPGTVTPDEPIKVHSNIFTGNNTRVFQGENGCEANVWAYNNVVYENENVFLHGSFRGFHLINNTFYDNDSHEADWDPAWMEPYPFSQDSMSLVVKNNIFAKDSSSNAYLMVIRTESGDSPDIELITRANMFHDVGYNDAATKAPIEFWEKNSTPTELTVDTAGSFLYGDPMYEAPELGEFTLLPTSPAIGAAEAVPEIGVAAGMNLGCLVTDLLPAELAALSASVSDGKVTLTWKTHTETDVKGFDVERKADGGSFAKIGHVGAAGTSSKERSYSFVDNAGSGKYAYRLKVVDLDGAFRYTKSVEVNLDVVTEYALEQNYPNPFNPTTTINFQIPQDANVSLTVYDVLGAKVATLVDGQMQAGAHRVDFNASNLATGAYFYRLEAGDFVSVKKMLLLK